MQGGFLLDIVIGQGSTVFQLLASEYEALVIRGEGIHFFQLLFQLLNCGRMRNFQLVFLAE